MSDALRGTQAPGPAAPAGPPGDATADPNAPTPLTGQLPMAPHPGAPGLPSAPGDTTKALGSMQGHYNLLKKQFSLLQTVKGQVDKLAELGDAVQPDDVIKAAGLVVGKGGDPLALAKMLADMPEQPGPALAGWVQAHAQDLASKEAQLAPALAESQHHMGVAALHEMVHHSMDSPQAPPAPVALPGIGA